MDDAEFASIGRNAPQFNTLPRAERLGLTAPAGPLGPAWSGPHRLAFPPVRGNAVAAIQRPAWPVAWTTGRAARVGIGSGTLTRRHGSRPRRVRPGVRVVGLAAGGERAWATLAQPARGAGTVLAWDGRTVVHRGRVSVTVRVSLRQMRGACSAVSYSSCRFESWPATSSVW